MKISEMLHRLSEILVEYGDIDIKEARYFTGTYKELPVSSEWPHGARIEITKTMDFKGIGEYESGNFVLYIQNADAS